MINADIASQTLRSLEERINRVQFLLRGDQEEESREPPSNKLSVGARLERLETSLANLKHNSSVVQQLLQLREHPATSRSRQTLKGRL